MGDVKMTMTNVKKVLEQMRSENIKPTFRIILERLGGGSYATLAKLKKRFPDEFVDMQTNKIRQGSGLEKRVFELELENMRLKYDSERRDLELRVERLIRELDMEKAGVKALALEARALSNSNESLRKELDSARERIKELEDKTACDAHEIDEAGTNSQTDSDTRQLPIESISQQKDTKARAIELHEQYPTMTQREITERLFNEGFKTRDGKRLGNGQISKWLSPKDNNPEQALLRPIKQPVDSLSIN